MKIGLLFLLMMLPLHADITAAKAAFDAGNFPQAYALFLAERTDTASSPSLEFNLGNTAFRKGDPALAVLHYRRAQWMSPGDPDVRANLERVQDLLGSEIPALPWQRRLTAFLPAFLWQGLWLGTLWIGALLLLGAKRIPRLRTTLAWAIPLLVVALGLSGFGLWGSSSAPAAREGVLTGGETVARFEPLDSSTRHFALPEGSVVTVEDQSRTWTRIRFGDRSGWIPSEQLLRL